MTLVARALAASRETRQIEFKEGFDPESAGEWCELVKDFVALANSGGGVLLIGLNNDGTPSDRDLTKCLALDPAELANKIGRYIGQADVEFEVAMVKKADCPLLLVSVGGASVPLVFEKPGTYEVGGGKQKVAFSVGTTYIRRGARSAPATTSDLRKIIDRRVESMRREWVKGVRRVVEAEPGSTIVALPSAASTSLELARSVRAVNDSTAQPVYIVRGQPGTGATFVHEELSGAIFDEINNVVAANNLLSRGKPGFVLGSSTYYRVYAERQHIKSQRDMSALFTYATVEQYAPFAYWMQGISPEVAAEMFGVIFLKPRNPQIHTLMKVAILSGPDWIDWILEKWKAKWGRHPQPPRFVHAFRAMAARPMTEDRRLVAIRMSPKVKITVGSASATAEELLQQPNVAGNLLSSACLAVFEGNKKMRPLARDLDILTHGNGITTLPIIFQAIKQKVGKRLPEDIADDAGSGIDA